jgi:hypothetical protein
MANQAVLKSKELTSALPRLDVERFFIRFRGPQALKDRVEQEYLEVEDAN